MATHKGECFCGAVKVEVSGEPEAMGYCHCRSCRSATLPTLKFTPGIHVNYAETVLPMKDGLAKMKDFPTAFGGSGEQVPE
jgi:hypothetical protein